MNEFEELVKNLNLSEEEINSFIEKNIVSDRVKRLTEEFLKEETFEKSGAPASNNDRSGGPLRAAGVLGIIERHNRRMREADRPEAVISIKWMAVASFFASIDRGPNFIPGGIMLTITLYLENNPGITSEMLLMQLLTAAGTVYIGRDVTRYLTSHFMNNEWAIMLGTMVALALMAIYTRQAINGTFGRQPIFFDGYTNESARINGVEASPRTAGVIGGLLRQRTRELENTDEQPTPRREPARRRLPMTRRERGRRRARSARRARRNTSELDKNNIRF